jgi:serine O-acetyltransferase
MLDHPVGSVMGRAKYSDYFSFGQNCTVGNNHSIYPVIGDHVKMCASSMILGNCTIGNNVIIGAGACVKDENIPDNSLVFGNSPNLIIKPRKPTE